MSNSLTSNIVPWLPYLFNSKRLWVSLDKRSVSKDVYKRQEVDSAIGDGDHGIGMATGMKNVKDVYKRQV